MPRQLEEIERKQFVTRAEDAGDRRIRFTISTESVDREGDVIAVDGWKLGAYMKNPVVLWAHDMRALPVARAADVRVQGKKLVAVAEFVPADIYPFAETVYRMVKDGFLNATSVGFRPIAHMWNAERHGYDFAEQELLEFSIVPVPANAEALVVSRGLDPDRVKAWLGHRAKGRDECPKGSLCWYPVDGGQDAVCPAAQACPIGGAAEARSAAYVEIADLVEVDEATARLALREVFEEAHASMVKDAVHSTLCRMTGKVD